MNQLTTQSLGPFEIGARIGAGGMSEVFDGYHRASRERVALKVTRFGAGDQARRRAFAAEISAMARLYHPGIVAIHDWGALPDGTGNWCAMDFAEAGCLRLDHVKSWAELRRLLRQLLSALGHAHARDIVHRDLKPQNVLVFQEDGDREYRLADFGLAYSRVLTDDTKVMGVSAGTPAYMAPEQLHGLWREYGPWTDLYAIGCMSYELAAGRPPFRGALPLDVAMAHLSGVIEPLAPRFAVPARFERWLHGLMERDWVNRPRTAATALAELDQLGEPDLLPVFAGEDIAQAATLEFDPIRLSETLVDLGLTPARTLSASKTSVRAAPAVRIPSDWRTVSPPLLRFGDTGLRLFALRQTDFIGHEGVRDAIWASLHRVAATGESQVVLLDSEQRRERHLLVDWLLQRTRESTGLVTIQLDLALERYGVDPFRECVEGLLATWRLRGDRLRAHLERALPRVIDRVSDTFLAEIVDMLESNPASIRGRLAACAVFWDMLTALSSAAPVVLALKGIERNRSAWFMLERLLREPIPVLAVATLGDEWLPTDSEQRVRASTDVIKHQLTSLDRDTIGELVDSYIQLQPELRETWIDLAVDDISFAMDSLRYGIGGRVLEPSPTGYQMVPGAPINRDPAGLLAARLAAEALEASRLVTLAAGIGESVSYDEWSDLAQAAGLTLEADIVETLLRHGWLREDRGRYLFESAQHRRLLLRHLTPEDNRVLRDAAPENLTGIVRVAELLLASGDAEAAAEQALRVLSARRDEIASSGWLSIARRIAARIEKPLHLELDIAVVLQVCQVEDPSRPSSEPIDELLTNPEYQRFDRELRELRFVRALAHCYRREFETAEAACDELLEEIGDDEYALRAHILNALGWILVTTGRYAEAADVLETSISLFVSQHDWGGASLAAKHRCVMPWLLTDRDEMIQAFQRAHAFAERASDPARLAEVWLERSLAMMLVGEPAAALIDAENAWHLGIWASPMMRPNAGANYALALGHVGRFEDAHDVLAKTERLLDGDHEATRRVIRSVACVLAALAGDEAEWQRQVEGGPTYDGIGVFARLAVAAWTRQGNVQQAAEAQELLAARPN